MASDGVLQAFYREGIALQCLGRFADALAAFAAGLALDSKSAQLLGGLVDAASRSPLKGMDVVRLKYNYIFTRLYTMWALITI